MIDKIRNMSTFDAEKFDFARKKTAEHLGIDLQEPKQEKRIDALKNLYIKYREGTDVKSLIYQDICSCCDQLIDIHKRQKRELDDLKITDDSLLSKKIKLKNIVYKFKAEISELEKKIKLDQRLLGICGDRYDDVDDVTTEHRKLLKEFEDKAWDNWLRAIDVNREWRNTVIGYENRKALLNVSKLYVDYHIMVSSEITKCFTDLKTDKKNGIKNYYDILSHYQLPVNKKIDFKIFLQKMIEAKLSDSMEVKAILGEFAEIQRGQINDLVQEIRDQYKRDQEDMVTIINYHKKFLLNQQVLFTNESENLVIYFQRRYMEKIDLLCSRFQMYHSEASAESRNIRETKMELFKKMLRDEFENHLNQLKMDFSKKAIPFLDNFWHLEQETGNHYALDEAELQEKLIDLKESKNLGMKSLIETFEEERKKLKSCFEKKLSLMEGMANIGFEQFDVCLKNLKDECDVLCSEIINTNARFWTKINAEFNCIFRKYFINLRHQYSPYVQSWRANCKPWMNEYLQINLNQELLKAVGEALEGISPESAYYKKIAKRLLRFNENVRSIMVKRDQMELEQLLGLNELPEADSESLRKLSVEKLNLREVYYTDFLDDYNSFYKEQLSK